MINFIPVRILDRDQNLMDTEHWLQKCFQLLNCSHCYYKILFKNNARQLSKD